MSSGEDTPEAEPEVDEAEVAAEAIAAAAEESLPDAEIDAEHTGAAEQLKNAMRLIPQQVWTLLLYDDLGEVRGMTATSAMPLSVDPPRMIVAVGKSRRTHGALELGARVGLSALAAGLEHVALHFAGLAGREGGVYPIKLVRTPDDTPTPAGALVTLSCEVDELTAAGESHTLATLRVISASSDEEEDPLLWCDGGPTYLER